MNFARITGDATKDKEKLCCFCGAKAESEKRTTITVSLIAKLIVHLRDSLNRDTNSFDINKVSEKGRAITSEINELFEPCFNVC